MRIGNSRPSRWKRLRFIKLKTCGVSFGYHACTSPTDTKVCEEGLGLSGSARPERSSAMYDLIEQLFWKPTLMDLRQSLSPRELVQSAASGGVDIIKMSQIPCRTCC